MMHFDNNNNMPPRTESNKRKRTPPRTGGNPPVTGQPKDDGSSTDSDVEKNTTTTRASARSTPALLHVMASLLTRIRGDSSAARSRDDSGVASVPPANTAATINLTSTEPSPPLYNRSR